MIVALWCALGFLALVVMWLLGQNDKLEKRLDEFYDVNNHLWTQIDDLRVASERQRRHADRQDVVIQFHQQAAGGFWTTGIGTKLRIRDMTDCHLRNAIAWCEQHGKDTTDLRAELKLRRRNKRMEAQQ